MPKTVKDNVMAYSGIGTMSRMAKALDIHFDSHDVPRMGWLIVCCGVFVALCGLAFSLIYGYSWIHYSKAPSHKSAIEKTNDLLTPAKQ